MQGWLVDTNVISETRRPMPDGNVIKFLQSQPEHRLFTSEIVLAEIKYGAESVSDEPHRELLLKWLDTDVRDHFGRRALPVGSAALRQWIELIKSCQTNRRTPTEPDLLLAAVAQGEKLIVASRDTKEFRADGVTVFDPWTWKLFADGRECQLTKTKDALSAAIEFLRRSD